MTNITAWEYFSKGFFNIQDESAGLACKLVDPKPGMRVLDLCAAPGGKTAYLAEAMQDTGEIVALDRYESRLKIMRKNIERLGITCIKTIEVNALEYNDTGFDRVLADVPCLGSGTLSKKPDIKWKKDLFDLRKINEAQFELMEKAANLVTPGGVLVYSTCSIEPEENSEVVLRFLKDHPEFKIESAASIFPSEVVDQNGFIQTLPHRDHMDGAFAAKLVKVQ